MPIWVYLGPSRPKKQVSGHLDLRRALNRQKLIFKEFSGAKICFGHISAGKIARGLCLAAFDREKIKEETFFEALGPFSKFS